MLTLWIQYYHNMHIHILLLNKTKCNILILISTMF